MRHFVVAFLLVAPFLLTAFTGNNTFEGNLTITSDKNGTNPTTMLLAVKNDQLAINPGSGPQMVLNVKTGDFFSVITQGTQKMVMKMNVGVLSSLKDMPSFLGPFSNYIGATSKAKAEVKSTEETKTINGYKCRKYTVKDETSLSTVWVTQDLPFNVSSLLDILKLSDGIDATMKSSFPMEGSIKDNKTSEVSNFKVSVEKKTVDEKAFTFPEEMPVLDMTPLVKQMMETNDPAQIKSMLDRIVPR